MFPGSNDNIVSRQVMAGFILKRCTDDALSFPPNPSKSDAQNWLLLLLLLLPSGGVCCKSESLSKQSINCLCYLSLLELCTFLPSLDNIIEFPVLKTCKVVMQNYREIILHVPDSVFC